MPYKDPEKAKENARKRCLKYRTLNKERIRENSRKNYKKRRKEMIEKQKRFFAKNRVRLLELKKANHLKVLYGITIDEYNNILAGQGGVCALCGGNNLTKKRKLAVDHCHKTKVIRGLLCDKCNRGLGFFDDNKEKLMLAIKYLEKYEKTS